MQHKTLFFLALFFTITVQAEDMLERSTMTSCAYQAGTAREIQTIRQSEGDDWSQFEQKITKIYKEGQGRQDLLVIAKVVYQQPTTTLTSVVYDNTFAACVKRTQDAATS